MLRINETLNIEVAKFGTYISICHFTKYISENYFSFIKLLHFSVQILNKKISCMKNVNIWIIFSHENIQYVGLSHVLVEFAKLVCCDPY